jgi:hypothetical protein
LQIQELNDAGFEIFYVAEPPFQLPVSSPCSRC